VQFADWLHALKIPQHISQRSPWSGQSDFAASKRVATLIDGVVWQKLGVQAASMTFAQKQDALRHVYVDISQNHARRPFTNEAGVTGTFTTSTLLYSFDRDNIVLPREMLYLHGHSRSISIPEEVKPSSVKSLAGEGMSLPCLGTVLFAGLLARDFS